ncbi:MAG: AmmeMemoRadiSam system protein B [Candidatus Omnitrophota bacterium]
MPGLKLKLFLIFLGLCVMGRPSFADNDLKEAGLAGSWYPGASGELSRMVDGYLSAAPAPVSGKTAGVIISPHAGYVFSAPVAAYGFKAATSRNIATVIILAPSHHFSFAGISVWPRGAFETPLGRIEVDADLAGKLLAADKRFIFRRDVFDGARDQPENSVETQLPMIQRVFPKAKIVPVIVGFPPDFDVLRALAGALAGIVGSREDVLVDVSVDQSHFHTEAQAHEIDARGLKAIEAMDEQALWQGHRDGLMEVDGFHVVTAAMLYAKAQGYSAAKVLKYATSADATGDKGRVVGYASVAFYKDSGSVMPAGLNDAQRARLLGVARATLESFVRTGKAADVAENDSRLSAEEGAFVTLHARGQLRGCIGNIIGQGPLYLTVRDMAVAAASQDPRFSAVSAGELKDIAIEISVLSKPRVIANTDEIVMGTHGVIVSRGFSNRGVFLPQVATETGWTKERFMAELCSQKAGLPPNCWKEPGTRIEIFTAEVFGEK